MSVETEIRSWLSQWSLPSADGDALVAIVQDLVNAARAEGAAEAIEAAARIADTEADNAATAARHVGGDDCWVKQQLCAEQAATAILHRIRALAPAGLVAVSVDRLTTLREAAAELEQRIRAERAGYDMTRADEIRAALSDAHAR